MSESDRRTKIVRPLRNGQVTIPAEFRAKLGIGADTLLQLTLLEGELRLRPVTVAERASGSPWLKELYELFAPVRDEARQYTEEEINAAIDEAVRDARERRA